MNNESKIALSVDVEDWYHTPAISGSSFAKFKSISQFFETWNERYDYLTDSTLRTLDLLNRHNAKATFFVVADVTTRYPEIMRALRESGHEIGCHGFEHVSAIDPATKQPFLSERDWLSDVARSREQLEQVFGKRVTGYRAPGAYFADWMVDGLEQMGFSYDSSIAYNCLYNKTNVVMHDIPTTPYFIDRATLGPKAQGRLIELPWSQYRIFGRSYPVGGAFFYRALGNTFFKHALKQNLKRGDTMFYFHPLDLTREPFPMSSGKKRPLYWINKGERTEKRLEKLLSRFSGKWTDCQSVAARFADAQRAPSLLTETALNV